MTSSPALLELRPVGELEGRFEIPRYQRGYRWGSHEVRRLLDDIWDNQARPYCLQPIVVMPTEQGWEVVDGQQRLTTLYLIFLYMEREGLQKQDPPFSITYATRPNSQAYLRTLEPERSEDNIDFHHLYEAYACIAGWFESQGKRRQNVANKVNEFLFDYVHVIWYEAPASLGATTLFTRLNVGRIPLTDAELVKALLLAKTSTQDGEERAQELAAQWDTIERQLRRKDVWAFISGTSSSAYPTRIGLLLDTLADGTPKWRRPLYHTFDHFRQRCETEAARRVWDDIVDLHELVAGWYEHRSTFHKIGYLVAVGQSFAGLVALAADSTKSEFSDLLDRRISRTLDLAPSDVAELSYDDDPAKCMHVLLLMNVETTRRIEGTASRYPFHLHAANSWTIEHIHAQHADTLNRADQWQEWLRLHYAALLALPSDDDGPRDRAVLRIEAERDGVDKETFQSIMREVTDVFTKGDRAFLGSVHTLSNLALLSSGDNSALNNSVFEVKRQRVLELDRRGEYIPICTRRVFLKYYTAADGQQLHFWSAQDRESYLNAMISQDAGVLRRYLKPEQREA